eukprot:516751-Karenia_brevis.AAC.1
MRGGVPAPPDNADPEGRERLCTPQGIRVLSPLAPPPSKEEVHGGTQIFVDTLPGKKHIVDIETSDTISSAKAHIQVKESISPDQLEGKRM